MMTFLVPIRTMSEANLREHWGQKARRVKVQRQAVAWSWQMQKQCKRILVASLVDSGLTITLTRIAPRALDSHDNLPRSMKAVVDQLSSQLCFVDRCKTIHWQYAQRPGKAKEYAVEVDIR
jgi:hypothetical protein